MYDNTIIVVLGDNGGYTTEYAWGFNPYLGGASNFPLRGQKGSQYEGGTRVPALIHAPGRLRRPGRYITQSDHFWYSWRLFVMQYKGFQHLIKIMFSLGRITNKMVHITDWLPTLITAAGGNLYDYPELQDIDGKDQVPSTKWHPRYKKCSLLIYVGIFQYYSLFRGGSSVRNSFVYNIYTNTTATYGNDTVAPLDMGAIRYGKWKLLNQNNILFHRTHVEPAGSYEMYDLCTDPTESTNVFDTYPTIAQWMVQKFEVLITHY